MDKPNTIEKCENITCTNDMKIQEQCISTNWRLTQDNKRLCDTVSITSVSKAPAKVTLEEIVTDDSCVILQPANANVNSEQESCIIDINLPENQKISRIELVSESSVLEFFKESGEYAGTEFAELIDEFEEATVYFAQLTFQKPTSQASIKFTRIHNSRSNMFLYGMKLVLEDDKTSLYERRTFDGIPKNFYDESIVRENGLMGMPDFTNSPDYDANFAMKMDTCLRSLIGKTWTPSKERSSEKDTQAPTVEPKKKDIIENEQSLQANIESYIDKKFCDMEKKLMQRICDVEIKTNKKLDIIIKHLESRSNTS